MVETTFDQKWDVTGSVHGHNGWLDLAAMMGLPALAVAIIEKARAAGYREMVLDTLTRLGPAVKHYERLGFERCEPYYANPEPDVIYLRLAL